MHEASTGEPTASCVVQVRPPGRLPLGAHPLHHPV